MSEVTAIIAAAACAAALALCVYLLGTALKAVVTVGLLDPATTVVTAIVAIAAFLAFWWEMR